MTDNEIIKALKSYKDDIGCMRCGVKDNYLLTTIKNALDLINRQQAEIERLSKKNEELAEILSDTIRIRYAEAKAETIKEFADEIQKEISILQKEYFERKKEREFELEQASYSLIIDRTLQYYRGKIEVLDAINLLINTKLKEMAGDKL